jgi:hypothetical protein
MPDNVTIIKVFVASPSDVQEERNALQSVVDEVNRNLASAMGLRLELIKWETNVTPAFGKDPQDIINKQIGDNYDIFIGILWVRVGTPTPRAESGTLEEFERAYRRHLENPELIDLLIYFKESPISISNIDIDQISKIKSFRDSLGEKGGLFWTFDGLSDFETTLRGHLSDLTRKWRSKIDKTTSERVKPQEISVVEDVNPTLIQAESVPAEIAEAINLIESEDDYGFLDYADIYNSSILEMNTALEGITKATINIGEKVSKQAKAIEQAAQIKDQAKVNIRVRKSLKIVSDDLHNFSGSLDKDIRLLSDSRTRGFNALGKSLVIYADSFPGATETLQTNEAQLKGLLGSMETPYQSMKEFRDVIAALPKFSSQFNRARREVITSLNKLLDELDDMENTIINLLDSISKLKGSD